MFYELPSHNLLRITRMLNSLNQVGNIECSRKLYKSIMEEAESHPHKISDATKSFWESTQLESSTSKEIPN